MPDIEKIPAVQEWRYFALLPNIHNIGLYTTGVVKAPTMDDAAHEVSTIVENLRLNHEIIEWWIVRKED